MLGRLQPSFVRTQHRCPELEGSRAKVCAIDDDECEKPTYVKFHHRGIALWALCHFHWRQGELPDWLRQMCRVRVEHLGKMTRAVMLARGYVTSASMQENSVKTSWLQLILQTLELDLQYDMVESHMRRLYPEIAQRINDWSAAQCRFFCSNSNNALDSKGEVASLSKPHR